MVHIGLGYLGTLAEDIISTCRPNELGFLGMITWALAFFSTLDFIAFSFNYIPVLQT